MIEFKGLKLYSVTEAMKVLKASRVTIYNYINKHGLKASRVGTVYYIEEKDLLAFLKTPTLKRRPRK